MSFEPIKFWARTKEDTENFFNYLRAMNIPDDLSWADSECISDTQEKGIGWCLDTTGDVTYFTEKSGYSNYVCKEFFFPIPVEEFVEVSEMDGQITCHKSIQKQHSHYYKSVQHLDYIDVYRVLDLFSVTNPCLQHSIKKLLVAGGRGAGKDIARDVQEAIDSLERWKEMKEEDNEK